MMRCDNCGALWDESLAQCRLCGSRAVERVKDVVELALEAALEQRATLELMQ